jgi:hypothetical protein
MLDKSNTQLTLIGRDKNEGHRVWRMLRVLYVNDNLYQLLISKILLVVIVGGLLRGKLSVKYPTTYHVYSELSGEKISSND